MMKTSRLVKQKNCWARGWRPQVRDKAIALYTEAADYAITKGIIIADTKFEFGQDDAGELYLIDEALTPDSSRFWPADQYAPGKNPPSYDKQFVRDWLETQDWNKKAPAPALPPDILAKTTEKYQEALRRLAWLAIRAEKTSTASMPPGSFAVKKAHQHLYSQQIKQYDKNCLERARPNNVGRFCAKRRGQHAGERDPAYRR